MGTTRDEHRRRRLLLLLLAAVSALFTGCTPEGATRSVLWIDGTWIADLRAEVRNPDGSEREEIYRATPIVVDQRFDSAVFWGLGANVHHDRADLYAQYDTHDLWTGYPKNVTATGVADEDGAQIHVDVVLDTGSGDAPSRYRIDWTIERLAPEAEAQASNERRVRKVPPIPGLDDPLPPPARTGED